MEGRCNSACNGCFENSKDRRSLSQPDRDRLGCDRQDRGDHQHGTQTHIIFEQQSSTEAAWQTIQISGSNIRTVMNTKARKKTPDQHVPASARRSTDQ